MAPVCASPDSLLRELAELEREVQAQAGDDTSFRKLNAGFDAQNETTQMLLDACDKLVAVKEATQRAGFEEHSSELPYLCKHFGSALDSGLPERTLRERQAAQRPPGGSGRGGGGGSGGGGGARRRRGLLALCCQQDFPPHQAWWAEASGRLCPGVQVLRAGKLTTSRTSELVPGDIVYLRAGQAAAVDGRVLVFESGTMVDMSLLTSDAGDVRACSSEPTGDSLVSSRNMVFRDSFVLSGALFCLAVRPASEPIVPCSSRDAEDEEFTVDVTLPPGLSMGQCKSTFKALCVQARLACRSFRAVLQLGRVGVVIVVLTQELLGSARALCTAARRLGRALVFVGSGCAGGALEELAREVSLELLSFGPPAAPPPPGAAGVTGAAGAAGAPGEDEAARLGGLAKRLVGQKTGGAVLDGLSQPGMAVLCDRLAGAGLRPLYAVAGLDFLEAFKSLIARQRRLSGSRHRGPSSTPPRGSLAPPTGSFAMTSLRTSEGQGASASEKSTAQALSPHTPTGGHEEAPRRGPKDMSSLASVSSQGTASAPTMSLDPAALLHCSRGDGAKASIELLVSLNSIGIVSAHADCVLLKSDLACLGLALEIAAKTASLAPAQPTELGRA